MDTRSNDAEDTSCGAGACGLVPSEAPTCLSDGVADGGRLKDVALRTDRSGSAPSEVACPVACGTRSLAADSG